MTDKLEVISREFSKTQQSFNLLSNYRIKNKSIKIEIKLDSYDFQSYAHSYLFTDQGWKEIYSIPYYNMTAITQDLSFLSAEKCRQAFATDEDKILDISKKILGIE